MDFYGTIGPACADVKLLQQMVEAGMTGIRMNLSHGPLAVHKDWLALLRKAGVKKLLIDLQGPELRIGRLPQPLSLTAGQTVRLGAQGSRVPIKQYLQKFPKWGRFGVTSVTPFLLLPVHPEGCTPAHRT